MEHREGKRRTKVGEWSCADLDGMHEITCRDWCMIFGHALLVTLVFGAALVSCWSLQPDDKITGRHGVFLFGCGALFFGGTFNLVCMALSKTEMGVRVLVIKYHCNKNDILDISNKITSAVQALFCCITGAMIIRHSCCRSVAHANHYVSHAYSYFGAAYFFYDIVSMYLVHRTTPPGKKVAGTPAISTPAGDPLVQRDGAVGCMADVRRFLRFVWLNPIIVGHHLFIGLFGFSVIIYLKGNLGDCVFGFVFLMEASTPFVSLRSILARFDKKSSKLYMYNGFAMLVVFFFCRIAMFPYVIHLYAAEKQMGHYAAIKSLPRGCKAAILVLMLPQFYWFCLMVRGATKIIGRIVSPVKRKRSAAALGMNSIYDNAGESESDIEEEDEEEEEEVSEEYVLEVAPAAKYNKILRDEAARNHDDDEKLLLAARLLQEEEARNGVDKKDK